MRKFIISTLVLLLLGMLSAAQDLIPAHEEWLTLVAPIITKMEREVFLSLNSAEERNRFIQVFWKQRDPRPDTEMNEFYQEYMKRVHYADLEFGRQSGRRGIETDRGFFYLLLGPPLERNTYTTHSQILPMEMWHYKGEVEYGLPSFFYLIFYQPEGIGEYQLYHPGIEGPEKLIMHTSPGLIFNREEAYKIVRNVNSELAAASLSYLPGERNLNVMSLSSETIIASIQTVPEKKYSDRYARDYLTYKDYVETDYTHNFIESSLMLKVFYSSGQHFLHWAIEPKSINFANYQDQYQAMYQLLIRMEDKNGNALLEKEEEIPLRITRTQYESHERQLFSFQDLLPVIPGDHTLFILLKNKTARDFTSHQRELRVPVREESSHLGPLLLYLGNESMGGGGTESLRAFTFSGTHYLVNSENNFRPEGDMGVFFQVFNLDSKDVTTIAMQIFPANGENAVFSKSLSGSAAAKKDGISFDTGPVQLSALSPGYYRLEIVLLDANGGELVKGRDNFIILAQAFPVIPWVFSKQHPPFPSPDHLYTLASQYFLARDYTRAKTALDQAIRMREDPNTRLLLGKTLYALQDYQESLRTVQELYRTTGNRETAKLIALNHIALKEWQEGLGYLEKLLESSLEIGVMNLAAECYLNLDLPQKALPHLRKSLELNPKQPEIRQLLEQTESAVKKKE
jgi:GWxTD domain-containing protein